MSAQPTIAIQTTSTDKEIAQPTTANTTIHTTSTYDEIGRFDVLCGRDKKCYNNIGNRRFRVMISLNLPRYLNCKSRFDRSTMIQSFSEELCESHCSVRFFKRKNKWNTDDDESFIELDNKQIREKVGHALRDAASQYNNNSNSKIESKEMITSKTEQPTIANIEHIHVSNHPNNNGPTPRRLSMFLFHEEAEEAEETDNCDDQEIQLQMPSINHTYNEHQIQIHVPSIRLMNTFNGDYNEPNIIQTHHQTKKICFSEERRTSCASFLQPIDFPQHGDYAATFFTPANIDSL